MVAQFDYVPFSRDELHFEAGDVIEVLMKRVDGWWKGRCGEQEGWFPSTFVVEIESDNEPKGNTANSDTRSSPFRTMEGKNNVYCLIVRGTISNMTQARCCRDQ